MTYLYFKNMQNENVRVCVCVCMRVCMLVRQVTKNKTRIMVLGGRVKKRGLEGGI